MTAALINHIWQSTLFALGAGLLTLALTRNGARFRYGLWFAASVKFLIPFALLGAAGGWVVTRLHPVTQAPRGLLVVRQVVEPFVSAQGVPSAVPLMAGSPNIVAHSDVPFVAIVLAVWALGAAAVLSLWGLRWRRVHEILLASSAVDLGTQVPTRASSSLLEPGVIGVFRQVLMIPRGIEDHLSAAEMKAVLAHELCHLRRHDNLTAAIHMVVEALFWFHPVVWGIGGRLIAERELACDEGVIGAGHDPRVYAESILKVCRLYLQSPLPCAAGVCGANLKKRVKTIMTRSPGAPLGVDKTLLVSTAAALAIAAPLAAGLLAAVPAAARTAILQKVGLPTPPAPTPVVADAAAPAAASDEATAIDADAHGARPILQGLKHDVEIVAAPGDALVAATHIEPVTAPDLHLAELTSPGPELAASAAETAPKPAAPPPSAACSLSSLATFHVDPRAYIPLIDGEINGRKVQFIVAVSSGSAVFRSAAQALDIVEMDGHERTQVTPTFTEVGYGWVHDLELDDMPRKVLSQYDVHEDFRVAVTDRGGGWDGTFNPAAVLGARFWALADDDIDLRAGAIRLVHPTGCNSGDALPFNGGAYSQTALLTPGTTAIEDIVTVVIDGVPMRAEIDTGASATLMTRQGALKLGRGWPLPNAEPQGQLATGGQGQILWAKARFKTFTIGEETIQNPRIAVADLYGRTQDAKVRRQNGTYVWLRPFEPIAAKVPDIILGADFFHAHHVLISNGRRRVYFVYNGAPIFQ